MDTSGDVTEELLGEPWADTHQEYEALRDVLVPSATEQFYSGLRDWDALDTKALGVLAVDAAALGVLIAIHQLINRFWWMPAVVLAVAGVFFIVSIVPRRIEFGPDLLDLYEKGKDSELVAVARTVFNDLQDAYLENDATIAGKAVFYYMGQTALLLGLLGCLPIVLLRPG